MTMMRRWIMVISALVAVWSAAGQGLYAPVVRQHAAPAVASADDGRDTVAVVRYGAVASDALAERLRTMTVRMDDPEETIASGYDGWRRQALRNRPRFLPMSRRMNREIDKGHFAYKGEVVLGLTASYGTLSSDDSDFMTIIDNIDMDGTVATVQPFVGYFYRDNRCVGVRFGYRHVDGELGNVDLDLGDQNDIEMNVADMAVKSNSYSFALFHRSYVGLDHKGRLGLFAEIEASLETGTTDFTNGSSGDEVKYTSSDNTRLKLAFNPGMAMYIFPNVCATVSIGLGGIQYNKITQYDAEGNRTGGRTASTMRFRLNILDINFGVLVHLWDKKKR